MEKWNSNVFIFLIILQNREYTSNTSASIYTFDSEDGLILTFDRPTPENSGTYVCKALYANTRTLQAEVKVSFFHDITFDDCPLVQDLVKGRDGQWMSKRSSMSDA